MNRIYMHRKCVTAKKVLFEFRCKSLLYFECIVDSNVVAAVVRNLCKKTMTIPANLKIIIKSDKFNRSDSVIHYMCMVDGGSAPLTFHGTI